jgi:heparosan-N-sulfate-glucuronate 5-epimerase
VLFRSNYRGRLGVQYNPIAIAQYGLGNYNLFKRADDPEARGKFLKVADWLTASLEQNPSGLWVWNHNFDWDYRDTLKAPWYSALAQGQGISVLVRAYAETGDEAYMDAARRAFEPMLVRVGEGGVAYVDEDGDTWLEEYLVSPPTHILNGFIWASWGVWDYYLATGSPEAAKLFGESVKTIKKNLHLYDVGFWSLYEQSGTRLKMMASPFYHSLHIVQLEVLHRLTGEEVFGEYAAKWSRYARSRTRRSAAVVYKGVFKLCYY